MNTTDCPQPLHSPTHVNVTALPEEDPRHLLAVTLEAVLHILGWAFLLPHRSISREGDFQVSEHSTLKEVSELVSETQYVTGHWKICNFKLEKSEMTPVEHGRALQHEGCQVPEQIIPLLVSAAKEQPRGSKVAPWVSFLELLSKWKRKLRSGRKNR